MNIGSIMKKLVIIFFCIYIISAILNLRTFDFWGDYTYFLARLCSFGTYILIAIITEIEVLLIRNPTHLRLCLLFWTIHLFSIIIGVLYPNFGIVPYLFIISPSMGIFSATAAGGQIFVFPFFCFIEVMQLIVLLLWKKPVKQNT